MKDNTFKLAQVAIDALVAEMKVLVLAMKPLMEMQTGKRVSEVPAAIKEETIAYAMMICGYGMAIRWLRALASPEISYADLEEQLEMQMSKMKDGKIDIESLLGKMED